MSEELSVLLMVAKRLEESKIIYMISGSMASNYYTIPRMTRDIDVVIELRQGGINQFVGTFEKDFWVDSQMVRNEVNRGGMFNLIHKEHVVKIDFILRQESEFQNSAFARRKKVDIQGQPVWIISAEDLIVAKLLWAKESLSEMQLNDVRYLLQTVEPLQWAYMDQWINTLGLRPVYEKVKP